MTTPQMTTESRADSEIVTVAYRKLMERKELTSRERDALRRFEREKEERLRWQYYASIPLKHWRQMSGRQNQVLYDQSARYGIPFGVAKIDLPAVVRALHDFLAENAVRLARDDDPMMQGAGSPALERYREERAELARLDRLERQRQLLPRDLVRESLGRLAAVLRDAGDALQRQFGAEAMAIVREALETADREITRYLTDADEP